MDELEKQLQAAAPILRAAEAPALTPPESAIKAMNDALARKFKQTTLLTGAQMRLLILQTVAESPMDGFGVVEKLTEQRVVLKTLGDGIVYGLLAQLENSGALEGRWRESGAAMAKTYRVTEKGSKLLNTDRETSSQLSALLDRVGAFGR